MTTHSDFSWSAPLTLHRLADRFYMEDSRQHVSALVRACKAHEVSLESFMAAWLKQATEAPFVTVPGDVPVQDILNAAKAEYRKPSGAGLENYGHIVIDEERRQSLAKVFARYNPDPDRMEVVRAEKIFARYEELKLNPPLGTYCAFFHRDGPGPNDYRVVIADRLPPCAMHDWHRRCGHVLPSEVFEQEDMLLRWILLHEIGHGWASFHERNSEAEADAWANREFRLLLENTGA